MLGKGIRSKIAQRFNAGQKNSQQTRVPIGTTEGSTQHRFAVGEAVPLNYRREFLASTTPKSQLSSARNFNGNAASGLGNEADLLVRKRVRRVAHRRVDGLAR